MKLVFRDHAERDLWWFAAYNSRRLPEGRKNVERSFRAAVNSFWPIRTLARKNGSHACAAVSSFEHAIHIDLFH